MVDIYTFYEDNNPYTPANINLSTREIRAKRKRMGARSNRFRIWMNNSGINRFHNTESEIEQHKPLFVNYSRHSKLTYIAFVYPDRCSVLNDGVWKDYANIQAATRGVYQVVTQLIGPPIADRRPRMIYLYTLYADIVPQPNEDVRTAEFAAKRSRAAARDAILLKWMRDNGIGLFPKTERDAQRYEPLFVNYSRRNTMLYILFQRPDRCSVLNNGVWTDYPDMTTATREIYRVSPNDWIQYHRNVAFK